MATSDNQTQAAQALFEQALTAHQQGRLADAQAMYDTILRAQPNHADALHLRGVLALQSGDIPLATELIQRAIVNDPSPAVYHTNLGNTFRAAGRFDDAIQSYRNAIARSSDLADVHNDLGCLLHQCGDSDTAAAHFAKALAIRPAFAEAHANLGLVLQAQGKLDEAIASLRQWARLVPTNPAAQTHLGDLLQRTGRWDDALIHYRNALHLEDSTEARAGVVRVLRGLHLTSADAGIRELVTRAFTEGWDRPANLITPVLSLVSANPDLAACLTRAADAWPRRLSSNDLYGSVRPAQLADDALFMSALRLVLMCDRPIEQFLAMARHVLLGIASSSDGAIQPTTHAPREDAGELAFYCALAGQSFMSDYVFALTDEESQTAQQLRDAVARALDAGAPVAPLLLVAVAAYSPLHEIPRPERLLERSWPEPVTELLTQQLREPLEERRLRDALVRLTPIDDAVSLQVRQQYEEHPYPRWVRAPQVVAMASIEDLLLQSCFPIALQPLGKGDNLDILIAGCGTGQHAAETALRFRGARVLAIDLSLASLGYAARMGRALLLPNIEYAQADILQLGSLGRSFDVIESVGVLHHLADPLQGWRVLLSLLRPGGLMKVGIYSTVARRTLTDARDFVAAHGYAADADGIRRCREELLSPAHRERFGSLAAIPDFYSTSMCRDLLFHVQEHRFTLPAIATALEQLGVRMVGFSLDAALHAAQYQQLFPDDDGPVRFEHWQAFEASHPDTFAGMYQFWLQKPA